MIFTPITASALERLWNCPTSAVLPASSRTLRVGKRGTDIHRHIQRVANGMPVASSLLLVPADVRATCSGIDFKRLWGDMDEVRSEVAYALNVRTDEVRKVGQNIDRAYPDLGADWIYGTLDLEGKRIDDVWVVPDVKTGFLKVEEPDENFQLGFGGRVLSLLHGTDEIDARILNIRTDGSVYTQPGHYDRLELDEWGDRFIEVVDGVAAARLGSEPPNNSEPPKVSEGSWCRYCPALNSCPAKTTMARAMLPTLTELEGKLAAMTLEQRGRAYEIAHDQIKPSLDRVLEYIKTSAVTENVPLSNGMVLAPTYQNRENFVQERALDLLRKLGRRRSR